VADGDEIEADFETGIVKNLTIEQKKWAGVAKKGNIRIK